jgi:hypothetical protein
MGTAAFDAKLAGLFPASSYTLYLGMKAYKRYGKTLCECEKCYS